MFWGQIKALMNKRRPPHDELAERSPVPLIIAIIGLLAAVVSFAIPDENLSASVFGSGLITTSWCIIYWFANPTREHD